MSRNTRSGSFKSISITLKPSTLTLMTYQSTATIATGRLMTNLLALISRWERNVIGEPQGSYGLPQRAAQGVLQAGLWP